MTRHIAQKIATAFVTIFVIITISFFLVHIMPGDPVIHLVGQEEYYYLLDNDPETLNKLIARYGLDDSLPVQLSLIHISEPTRLTHLSRMPSSA